MSIAIRAGLLVILIGFLHVRALPGVTRRYTNWWLQASTPAFDTPVGLKLPAEYGLAGKAVTLLGECMSCDNEAAKKVLSIASSSRDPILVIATDLKAYQRVLQAAQRSDIYYYQIQPGQAFSLTNGQKATIGKQNQIQAVLP